MKTIYLNLNSIQSPALGGHSLPPRVAPDHTIVHKKIPQPLTKSKRVDPRSEWNGIRKLDDIVNSGAYEKSDFKPTPQSINLNFKNSKKAFFIKSSIFFLKKQ